MSWDLKRLRLALGLGLVLVFGLRSGLRLGLGLGLGRGRFLAGAHHVDVMHRLGLEGVLDALAQLLRETLKNAPALTVGCWGLAFGAGAKTGKQKNEEQ